MSTKFSKNDKMWREILIVVFMLVFFLLIIYFLTGILQKYLEKMIKI